MSAAVAPTYLSTLSGNTPIPAFAGVFVSASFLTAWPLANRAIYIPFFIPTPYTVQRFVVGVGNGVGNFDVGIYDFNGNKLVSSGSTASARLTAVQYVAPLGGAYKLQPGRYYYAIACDTITAGVLATGTTGTTLLGAMEMTGCLQQDSAFPLPSSYTPAEMTASFYALFGITQTAS